MPQDLPITYAKPVPTLATVRAYLTQHGYTVGKPTMRGDVLVWETWHHNNLQTTRPMGHVHSIELPCLTDARDYSQRFIEFLQELARLEGYHATGPLYDAIVQHSVVLQDEAQHRA